MRWFAFALVLFTAAAASGDWPGLGDWPDADGGGGGGGGGGCVFDTCVFDTGTFQ